MDWKPEIEVMKTVKNYLIPSLGMGLTFISQNCNTDVTVLGGVVTVGMITAFLQNTIIKNTPDEVKEKLSSVINK